MNSLRLGCLFIVILQLTLNSCKKFVEIDPPITELVSSIVFSSDASAKAAVDGIYSRMAISPAFASGGSRCFSTQAGTSADELLNYSSSQDDIQFFENSIFPTNGVNQGTMWAEPYQLIYSCNAILEGLSNSSTVSLEMKKELIGATKFIRAFFYFYLINMFGDVPLILSTDYRVNSKAYRSSKSEVYSQIIADLEDAKDALPSDYSSSNNERIRPNKWTATAMLARTFLYLGDWVNAETESNSVINNTNYILISDLNAIFLKNSSEAIWQLMPTEPGYNTNEGRYFILTSAPTIASLRNELIGSFEVGDNRLLSWIDSFSSGSDIFFFPYKYKISNGSNLVEYSMVLRLAEQYLIRAEARAQQGNTLGAQNDLNSIRLRAGLPAIHTNDKDSLLKAILHERQVELFFEWGHRWLDLIRTGNANSVLGSLKTNWQATDILFPIPSQEIQNNPHITQNPGY